MQRPILLTAAWLLGASAAGGQTDSVRSTRAGVYSEPQARRGQAAFEQACVRCHQPEFFEGNLLLSWAGARARALFEVIQRTMPEDRPASLRPQQYADILAYLFELNGIPPGNRELPSDSTALARILIQRSSR